MSLIYIPILLSTVFAALLVWYYKISFQYWKKRNVPYLTPTIPFGHYKSFVSKRDHFGTVISNYYQTMKLKKHKFAGFYLVTKPLLILIDPEIIKLIMSKEFQFFSHRSLFYDEENDPISAHLIAVNGKKWRMMRSKMTPAFSSGKIKMMFKIVGDCAHLLVNEIDTYCKNEEHIDIRDVVSHFTTNVIGSVVFGLNLDDLCEDVTEFKKYTIRAFAPNKWRSIIFLLGTVFPKFCRFIGFRPIEKEVGDYFIDMVRENVTYREEMKIIRNDFLQILISMRENAKQRGEEFSMEQLAAQCFIFLVAGYETTTTTIAFALFELARHPEIEHKIRQETQMILNKHNNEITYEGIMEMKYLTQVLEETLRRYSPATYVGRICTHDYQLPNTEVTIEKGVLSIIPIQGIHHDPEIYPDPYNFDPDRFSEENMKSRPQYSFLPFGSGPRNCIGLRFAMLEAKVSLAMLLKNYKFCISPKCNLPLIMNPNSYLLMVKEPIYLLCEKITQS